MTAARRALVLALLGLSGGCGRHPSPPPVPATGPAAAADLLALVDYLRAVHPEPHRFISAEALDALAAREAATLAAQPAPSELEVGRAFHTVLAAVRDAHIEVSLGLYGSTAPLSLLPLLPHRVGDGTYLIDAATTDIDADAELTHLDQRPMDEVTATLSTLVIAEGLGEAPRARKLDADFARFYHLAYGMADTYTATLRLPDGTEQELVLAGADRETLRTLRTQRRSQRWGSPDPAPRLTPLDEGTALLRLASFGSPDLDGYRAQVDALFAGLDAEVRTLVVDVRGNQGGFRPSAVAVLNHLLRAPYQQWQSFDARVRVLPEVTPRRLSFPFFPEESLAAHFPPRTLAWEGDPLVGMMTPLGTYTGPVVLLVDGQTGSAANTFVLALRRYRPDVLILGEELGGECSQHIGEFPALYHTAAYPLAILHSLIRVRHIAVEGCVFGRGLAPDLPVVETVADVRDGIDPYLRTLREARGP